MNKKSFLSAMAVTLGLYFSPFSPVPETFASHPGTKLSVTQEGIDVLTSELSKMFLGESRTVNLPRVETTAAMGIKVVLEGISAKVKIDQVKIVTKEGSLDFSLNVRMAHVHVNTIRASKGTIFGNIGFSCYGTDLKLGGRTENPLRANLIPSIHDGEVRIKAGNVKVGLKNENFYVLGPNSCSGGILGRFVKAITHSVLVKSREKIQDLVRSYIPTATAFLGAQLTQLSQQDLNFNFNIPPYFPHLKMEGRTVPYKVEVAPDYFALGFGWQFIELLNIPLHLSKNLSQDKNLQAPPEETLTPFGGMELSESLFNQVLSYFLKQTRVDLEKVLNDFISPKLGVILRQDILSAIIPDLDTIVMDSPELKGRFSITSIPTVKFNEETSQLIFNVPSLSVALSVSQGGVWRPYFHFDFNFSVALKTTLKNNRLSIEFQNLDAYDVAGKFDPDYHPQDETFNKPEFMDLLETLKEVIVSEKPKFSIDLPAINLGRHRYFFQDARLEEGALKLNILFL